jgi:hypothetical protein
MWKKATSVLFLTLLISGCSSTPPSPEHAMDWGPSRLALSPTVNLAPQIGTDRSRPPLGKFSLRFYQKLKAHPAIAPLAEVDIWELRDHPRQYDIITIGPVSFREYSGRKELLDQLTTTHGLTKEKAKVLTDWLRTGGVLWVEFGVFIQGYEWIRSGMQKTPSLPDLAAFTIFGLPTHTFVFEAERSGAFTIEPAVISFHNTAQHAATADIRALTLRQSDLKTVYPIINAEPGEALVRDGDKVYATVVPFGEGKIISTLPFDRWDIESDGEKYRINLLEWLASFPIPPFEPKLDVERTKD